MGAEFWKEQGRIWIKAVKSLERRWALPPPEMGIKILAGAILYLVVEGES